MVKQTQFQVHQQAYESLPLVSHKISENKFVVEIPNTDLELLGLPIAKKNNLTKLQTLDQQMVILVNQEILDPKIPNGIYTWIMYCIQNKPFIIFSPVETFSEFSNKHNNMNYIASKRNIIPTKLYFNEMGEKKKKTSILYAGECKKEKKTLTFNFLSGTYSLKIKQSLAQNQKQQIQKKDWFPSLKDYLKELEFPIQGTNQKSSKTTNWTIEYSKENFINWNHVKFRKEKYILLQPHRKSRYIIGSAKEIRDIRKKINRYIFDLETFHRMPKTYRLSDHPPELPKDLKDSLHFLDEMKQQRKPVKSEYLLRSRTKTTSK